MSEGGRIFPWCSEAAALRMLQRLLPAPAQSPTIAFPVAGEGRCAVAAGAGAERRGKKNFGAPPASFFASAHSPLLFAPIFLIGNVKGLKIKDVLMQKR